MSLTTTDRDILDNSDPVNQKIELGTKVYNLSVGVGMTLPTSDPSVAGQLWNNSGVVTVSAG